MMIRKRKRLWALFLSAALTVTQLPAVAMAENSAPEDGAIASFEELPSGVKKQTVAVGTELSELTLPDTVTATIYHVTEDTVIPDEDNTEDDGGDVSIASPSDAGESVSGNHAGDSSAKDSGETVATVTTSSEEIPVTWDSEPAYDGDTEGEYVFTADADGYTLSGGAKLPQITVTVSADTVENPTEKPTAEPLPCALTEGCTLVDGHEGECVLAGNPLAATLKTGGSWDAGTGVLTVAEHETGKLKAEAEALLGSKVFNTVKTLNVSGEAMDNNDFETIKSYFAGLETLDFSGCAMTEVPDMALNFQNFPDSPLQRSLTTVVLPVTVSRIGISAFRSCYGLMDINLGEITEVGSWAFFNCSSLTGIDLVKAASIGDSAFFNCESLGQVDLSGLQTLGETAFAGCQKLTLAPGSLQKLEGPAILFQTFGLCVSLGAVTLPPAVTELEASAFSFIPNLELTLEYDGVVEIVNRTFRNSTGLTVRVPEGQVEAYQQDGKWAALIASGVDVLSSTSYPITYHLSAKPEAIGFPVGEFPDDFQPAQFVGKGNNPDTYTPGVQVTLNPADCTGTMIEFGGWYTDADYQHPITEIVPGTTGPISLYAKPEFLTNYIYFNPLGGVYKSNNLIEVPLGPGVFLGAAARQGFEFKTWSEQAKTVDGERVADLSDPGKTHDAGSEFSPTQTFTVLYAAWKQNPVAAKPVAAPAGGEYSEAQTVTLTSATSGAVIYYTLDTTDPVTSGTRQTYSAPFSVPLDTTLKTYATALGYTDSEVLTERYTTAVMNQAAKPVAAPAGGEYSEAQTVTLTSATSGTVIYYTLDGTDPVTSGTRQIYSAPFSVPLDTTLKAYATASGYTDSAVLTEVYIKKIINSGSSSGSGSSSVGNTTGDRTYDAVKGWVSAQTGIITGTGSGYSKWIPDEKGWKLQYADGTMAAGAAIMADDGRTYERLIWELINGAWYAFGADGYAKSGLVFDPDLGGTFYIEINTGMKTGWQLINGIWYYFNPVSDGKKGIMLTDAWIDGWYVDKNGIWNGKAKKE